MWGPLAAAGRERVGYGRSSRAAGGRAIRLTAHHSRTKGKRSRLPGRDLRDARISLMSSSPTGEPGASVVAHADVIAFVATTDLARARAFYEGVLGLPL